MMPRVFSAPLAGLFIATMCACSATARTDIQLPPNHSLLSPSAGSFLVQSNPPGALTMKFAPTDPTQGPSETIEAQANQRTKESFDLQISRSLSDVALKRGDIIWLAVSARMLHTEDESGQGLLGIVLEESATPFDKIISRQVSVTGDWQQFALPAKVTSDYPADSLHVTLRLGSAAQTLQIGGMQLLRFDDPSTIKMSELPQTRITYAGREADAPWRAEAAARIEEIRKAPLTVHVVDAAGKPVSDAQISVVLRRHAFPFGSAFAESLLVGPKSQTTDALTYQQKFAELFNSGVDENGMKWPSLENAGGPARALEAIDWMQQHGIAVRGHNLVWPNWRHLPGDLKTLKDDPAALRQKVSDHITETAKAFAGRVTEWDVVNEPYVNHDLMDILGYPEMAEWFKLAHAADPSARLILNETSVPTSPPGDHHYDVLYEHAHDIQTNGGPLDGIGMQAHFGSQLTSPTDLKKIYDRFATLNVPLEITELDIDVADEQVQADYMRDFMTMSFSHPNVSGITMWGFWAGQHWRPSAALFTKDWQLRPVGQTWMDLVQKQWQTHEDGRTDGTGAFTARGFLGTYDVTVTVDGKPMQSTATLAKPAGDITVTLR